MRHRYIHIPRLYVRFPWQVSGFNVRVTHLHFSCRLIKKLRDTPARSASTEEFITTRWRQINLARHRYIKISRLYVSFPCQVSGSNVRVIDLHFSCRHIKKLRDTPARFGGKEKFVTCRWCQLNLVRHCYIHITRLYVIFPWQVSESDVSVTELHLSCSLRS